MIINKKLLAQFSPLPINYNYEEVMNYVPIATEVWIRPLIGDDLYYEIEEQVEKNDITDEINALLTDGKLLQYLGYATCLEGLPFIAYHFSEAGVTKAKTDYSESIDGKNLSYIENHLRRQVEFLKDSVKRYICERPEYYPNADFCACGCSCCNDNAKLNSPNKWNQLYKPYRRCTDIK